MERRLHQCSICKEWFNTTSTIMINHYLDIHPTHIDEFLKNFHKSILKDLELPLSWFTPSPLSYIDPVKYISPIITKEKDHVTFHSFQRLFLSMLYRTIMGRDRFFSPAWWRFKLRINKDYCHPGYKNVKSIDDSTFTAERR